MTMTEALDAVLREIIRNPNIDSEISQSTTTKLFQVSILFSLSHSMTDREVASLMLVRRYTERDGSFIRKFFQNVPSISKL